MGSPNQAPPLSWRAPGGCGPALLMLAEARHRRCSGRAVNPLRSISSSDPSYTLLTPDEAPVGEPATGGSPSTASPNRPHGLMASTHVIALRGGGVVSSRAGPGRDPGPSGPHHRRVRAVREGAIAHFEARLQGRRVPRILQPYYDIAKLFRKETLVPEDASWVFLAGPDRGLRLLPDRAAAHPGADELSRCRSATWATSWAAGFILALAGFSVALAAAETGGALRPAREQPGDDLRRAHRAVDPVRHLHRGARSPRPTCPTSRPPPSARRSARSSGRRTCSPPSPSSWSCSPTPVASRSRPMRAPSSSG